MPEPSTLPRSEVERLDRIYREGGLRAMATPHVHYYVDCPRCGSRIKVRSFSAGGEIEDVFDAVFEWMNQPTAQEVARRRQMALKEED
jgi:hypothetical protein